MSSRADPLPLGTATLLFVVAGACLVGMVVTIAFRLEPRGRSLEEISATELSALGVRVTPA